METIRYTNEFLKVVTEAQIGLLDNYYKQVFVNNELKKVENYLDQTLFSIEYYVSDSESLTELQQEYENENISFFTNKIEQNGFISYEILTYEQGVLTANGQEVLDAEGRDIYSKTTRTDGRILLFEKSFYLNNHEYIPSDEPVFNFFYDDTGSLKRIIETNIVYWEDTGIRLDELQNDSDIRQFFRWEDQTYFHSGDPAIPGTPIV